MFTFYFTLRNQARRYSSDRPSYKGKITNRPFFSYAGCRNSSACGDGRFIGMIEYSNYNKEGNSSYEYSNGRKRKKIIWHAGFI